MSNRNKKIFILIIIVVILIAGVIVYHNRNEQADISARVNLVKNFYDCQAEGFVVTESYPRQCRMPDGTIYVEDLLPDSATTTPANVSANETSHKDLVKVNNLKANDLIKSPFVLKGEARGSWFSEAVFPISILDNNGKEIGRSHAQALTDWMTTEYVSWSATLSFISSSSTTGGQVVLEKDNPSGLSENADSFKIPVRLER